MKTWPALAFGLLLSAFLAPQLQAAPQFGPGRDRSQGRDRVCVYQDIRYQGAEECYTVGDEVRRLQRVGGKASSIRIFGRARVTVYDENDFRGRTAEFSSDIPDLNLRAASGGHTWNDRIESLRVTSDYDIRREESRQDEANRRTNRFNDGICVYDRRDYEGREQCWSVGEDVGDLGRAGNWSDRISSIRVFGRASAVLYRDIAFRGESIVIDRDTPDLGQIPGRSFRNWDRQISSLAVESDRGFPGRGRARGRFWR